MKKKLRIKKFPDGGTFKPIKGTKEQYQAYQDSLQNSKLLDEFKLKTPATINLASSAQDYDNRYKFLFNEYYNKGMRPSKGLDIRYPVYHNKKFSDGLAQYVDYPTIYPVQPIIPPNRQQDNYIPNWQPTNIIENGFRRIEDRNGRFDAKWEEIKRPKEHPIQLEPKKADLLQSFNPQQLEFNPIPFTQGTYFSRERQNQELDSKQFGRKGKTDYFDKTTGKLLGTFENGGYLNMKKKIKKYADGGWNNSTTPSWNTTTPRLTGMSSDTQPAGFTGMGTRTQPVGMTGSAPTSNPNSYSRGNQESEGASSTISAFGKTQGTGDYLSTSLSGVANSMNSIVGYNPNATKATGYNKDVRNFNKFQKASTSTGTKVGRGIGIAALNFIPFVGPILAAIGAPAVDAMVEGRRKQLREKAEKSLANQQNAVDVNSRELTLNPQVAQMAKGGTYNGGPVQLEKDETLLRQLPNGGTIVERYNLPTHEQSGDIPNTYMNKPDYAATPNFGYNKYGQITLNPKEVKMTFADKTKKVENRFKRNHADPIADKTKEMALNQIKQDNEILKSALEQAQTTKMMYGGSIPKARRGLSGRELVGAENYYTFDDTGVDNLKAKEIITFGPQQGISPNLNRVPTVSVPKSSNQAKVGDKSKFGLTAGDYTQLAAGLPSIAYSLAMGAKKPEVERFGRDLTPIREQVLAKDYNPLVMAQNAGMATLNDSTNAASRNANLISLISNVAGEKAKYSLATDAQNAALARQRDQLLSGQRQANIGIGIQEKDTNARNRAARQHQTAKAFDLMTQTGFNLGKSLQTKEENTMKYNSLNSLAANYDLTENADGTITFKKKTVTKQKYGGYLKKNK